MFPVISWFFMMASSAMAQRTPGGPTQVGLPDGCLGSYPDISLCIASNWSLTVVDECKPAIIPLPGQLVYIKDEKNFCINLPDPDSIYLQQKYYNQGKIPSVVDAEGYVRSFCTGDHLPPRSLSLPAGSILSAHVVKYDNYIQIHGTMDCSALNINCSSSSPGAFDDGGQYDDGPFHSCGKEPYSGVDTSVNSGMPHYIEMAGDGQFCMRVCAPDEETIGGKCDLTHDTEGCTKFMGVSFTSGFSFEDNSNSSNSTTTTGTASPSPVSSMTGGISPTATTAGITPTATALKVSTTTNGQASGAGSNLVISSVCLFLGFAFLLLSNL